MNLKTVLKSNKSISKDQLSKDSRSRQSETVKSIALSKKTDAKSKLGKSIPKTKVAAAPPKKRRAFNYYYLMDECHNLKIKPKKK
jgi:hypothetical protein